MDHSIESIYYDLLDREMSDRGQPMSLWGPGYTHYKLTTTSTQESCGNSGISIPVYTSHGQVLAEEGQKPAIKMPEITQPTSPDGPAEIVLQGLKPITLAISGGGTVARWMVVDRDGLPLRSETGDIIWKEFPPNKNHVLEAKDSVTE